MTNGYHWEFNSSAYKQFKKLDRTVQLRLVKWLDDHIQGFDNPRAWGKELQGNLSPFWRYRVGSYRIIADIQDEKFTVLVVKTAKRGEVYR
jgi:mRNA interferase RelE/StbE